MKNRFLLFVSAFFIGLTFLTNAVKAQVDPDASDKTKALYANLKITQNSEKFLFGQEFFNSFRFSSGSAHGDKEYSDCKAVTGVHPAVLGTDFHYYLEKNDTERGYHTEATKWAYQQGMVITCDWHISARNTNSYQYSAASANLVNNIVNDLNGDRAWYFGEVDKVINIINNDFVVNGERIPIVFRPLHEMNGNWFWWGSSATTAANYKTFYQLLVSYMKERTNSVLFAWTPNSSFNGDRYPGDDYVDVVGVDIYEATTANLRSELGKVVDFAQLHNKIAVLSETGDRNSDATAPQYWKNIIIPGILNDPSGKSKKIAWILTWINANWSEPYVAHPGSSEVVKQSFVDFKNSSSLIFSNSIPAMYTAVVPDPVTAIPHDLESSSNGVRMFPIPANNDELTIDLQGFSKPTKIDIHDTTGKLINEVNDVGERITIYVNGLLRPGMYLLRVSDHKKAVTKKLLVN